MKNRFKMKYYMAFGLLMMCLIAGAGVHNANVQAANPVDMVNDDQADKENANKDNPDKDKDNSGNDKGNNDSDTGKSLEDIYTEKGYVTLDDLKNVKFGFEKPEYTVIVSDSVAAGVNCNVPETISRVEYVYSGSGAELAWYNSEEHTVQLKGNYGGISKVTMKLIVSYCDDKGIAEGEKTYLTEASVNVISLFEASIKAGDSYTLTYKDYEQYNNMTYALEGDTTSVELTGSEVIGLAEGNVSVYLKDANDKKIYIGQVYVKGNDIAFEEETVNRAIGSEPYQLRLNNSEGRNITWFTSASAVATVSSTGVVTPVSEGTATITAYIITSGNKSISYTCVVNVTNPVIDSGAAINLAKGYSIQLGLAGTTSKGEWKSSKKSVVDVYSDTSYYYNDTQMEGYGNGCTIYAGKKGSAVISVAVDGVIRTVTVTVTDPKIYKNFCILPKGGKQVIKINGINGNSKVSYKSSKTNVATVSSKGIIKAKKTGYTSVLVTVDYASYVVSVNVGSRKAVKAVMNAVKVEGATYSQARRMQKGYYDCSSLVWRSYKPVGMNFGDSSYAPVAANQAAYCVRHKMTVSTKKIRKNNVSNLNVGDVIFFAGPKNGRYKNIYHVAIYMGREGYSYGKSVYTSGRIIHANGSKVSQSSMYNHGNVVVIGRPFK